MTNRPHDRIVLIEEELRIAWSDEPGKLARVLKAIREMGRTLKAHLVYRQEERTSALLVVSGSAEPARALAAEGADVGVEKVVTVRTENRPGALDHLLATLEAEGLQVTYSYGTVTTEDLFAVFQTDDNSRAAEALRRFLLVTDPGLSSTSAP